MLLPDKIVEVLLTQIALCGPQGASPVEVLVFIEDYFHGLPLRPNGRPYQVNRKLQETVWTWLTANPEVSVGKNRKWNALTLAEAENLQAQSEPSAANVQPQQEETVRVFVSEDRIRQAITGAKRDDKLVTELEYELLCIIASRKSQGILQTELIQLSGQDKRSVPKRTDALQHKGYIEKRQVQAKSVKTSLCTLWRFVSQIPAFSVTQTPAERESKARQDDSDIIDTGTFVEQIFKVLKEHELISRNDLKRAMGLTDVWRWRILSRTIRKLEGIGCVRRVKALSQYNDTMKATHPCVMLIREPTERDLALFFEDTRLFTNLDQDNDDDDVDATNQEIIKDPKREVVQWAPERVHPNILQDIVTQAGTEGTTNIKLVKKGYGPFFRRSVETTMARLSEAAQHSQPPWLRSKGIVRDVHLSGTIIHYVHYAIPKFAEKVEKGEAKWEAVEFRPKDAKSQKLKMPSFEDKPELDNDGFPPMLQTNILPETSLLGAVTARQPPDYTISVSDPTIVRGENGKFRLHFNENDRRGRKLPCVSDMPSKIVEVDLKEHRPSQVREANAEAEEFGPNTVLSPVPKKPRKSKKSRFEGMTLKESYEAFGMDMGWTNYSALVMERLTPGVYVTPKGKARPFHNPLGRGRHRAPSQIAIFKTTKLSQLPWFQTENVGDATPSEPVLSEQVNVEEKGKAVVHNVEESTASSSKPDHLDEEKGKAAVRSAEETITSFNKSIGHDIEDTTEAQVPHNKEIAPSHGEENPMFRNYVKRSGDVPSVPVEAWPPGEVLTTHHQETVVPEVERSQDANVVNVTDIPSDVPAGESLHVRTKTTSRPEEEDIHVEDNTKPTNEKKEDGIIIMPTPDEAPEGPSGEGSQAFTGRQRKMRLDRGGSVAVLRREIIMDIVKKAGGAFPLGTELWHAFVTVWMKTDHKEKPDSRTVRSTAKYLIDAGKLRQQTFSGKDKKGIMVTRDIIMDSAISPDDPVVKTLQKDMLAADKYFVPAGVEVDPRVSKASRMTEPVKPRGKVQQLPFQEGVTVQLHQKPAFVVAQEKRKAKSLQRRLFRAMESGAERGELFGGPVRLMTIKRPWRVDGMTSISRPAWVGATASSTEAMSRLFPGGEASEIQVFGNKRRMIPQSLAEIVTQVKRRKTMASPSFDPRTTEFFNESDVISKWELRNESLFDSKGNKLAYINQTVGGRFEAAPVEGSIHFDIDEPLMRPRPLPPRKITRRIAKAPARNFGLQLDQFTAAPPVEPLPLVWPPPEQLKSELDGSVMVRSTHPPPATAPLRRRVRKTNNLPETLILKLKHAIVVIQMLLGGGTHAIDWPVVASLFPDYDPEIIRTRGKGIALRDKEQLKQMAAHFDELFIPAYLNDEVPSINYDDLDSYPWDTVVEWAMAQSDIRPSQRVPELPASREEFDRLYEIRLDPPVVKDLHSLFTNNPKMTIAKRQTLLASVPYVIPLQDQRATCTEPKDKSLVQDATVQNVANSSTEDIAKQQESFAAQKETLPQNNMTTIQTGNGNLQENISTAQETPSAPEESHAVETEPVREAIDVVPPQEDVVTLKVGDTQQEGSPEKEKAPMLQQEVHVQETATTQDMCMKDVALDPSQQEMSSIQERNITQDGDAMDIDSPEYVAPQGYKTAKTARKSEIEQLEIAKSWVRANVVTRDETYNAANARWHLARFPEPLLDDALNALITERVITQGNRGRISPGRNYSMTDLFLSTLGKQRAIDSTMLHQANQFKRTVLDDDFRNQGFSEVRYNARDGDILALICLAEDRRIHVSPANQPREPFGLAEGGYETRVIDKKKYHFAVRVRPVHERYDYGNPVRERIANLPPPKGSTRSAPLRPGELPEKLPVWFDINGGLVKSVWDLCVSSVVGIVAVRPHLDAAGIVDMVRPMMATWDVEHVLSWLHQAGVLALVGNGWVVREYWWMIVV